MTEVNVQQSPPKATAWAGGCYMANKIQNHRKQLTVSMHTANTHSDSKLQH